MNNTRKKKKKLCIKILLICLMIKNLNFKKLVDMYNKNKKKMKLMMNLKIIKKLKQKNNKAMRTKQNR